MGDKSGIEWTDATWNPVTGCTKVSQGCKYCYAERIFHRAYGSARVGDASSGEERPREFTDIRMHPDRLDQPLRWKRPRRIFVNSMSDLFHPDAPDDFLLKVFEVMTQSENGYAVTLGKLITQHTFQILTKRPARMLDFCSRLCLGEGALYLAERDNSQSKYIMRLLRHVWLGVSIEDQATADERIPFLLQTPAAVRFVSYEPALGPVDFKLDHLKRVAIKDDGVKRLDWIIAGGESGPRARPSHPDWFRSVREQCAAAGVPFFFKQWGEWAPRSHISPDFQSHNVHWGTICADGKFFPQTTPWNGHDDDGFGEAIMVRVRKKAGGRLLDGRIHEDYPL